MIGDKFHEHLDACVQCANNPFALCQVGAALLKEVPGEIAADMGQPTSDSLHLELHTPRGAAPTPWDIMDVGDPQTYAESRRRRSGTKRKKKVKQKRQHKKRRRNK